MAAETLLIYESGDPEKLSLDRFPTVNQEPHSGREHQNMYVVKSLAY